MIMLRIQLLEQRKALLASRNRKNDKIVNKLTRKIRNLQAKELA